MLDSKNFGNYEFTKILQANINMFLWRTTTITMKEIDSSNIIAKYSQRGRVCVDINERSIRNQSVKGEDIGYTLGERRISGNVTVILRLCLDMGKCIVDLFEITPSLLQVLQLALEGDGSVRRRGRFGIKGI
jgi:hypothetical protein